MATKSTKNTKKTTAKKAVPRVGKSRAKPSKVRKTSAGGTPAVRKKKVAAKKAPARKRGRPTVFCEAVVVKVLEAIMCAPPLGYGIEKICAADESLPTDRTWYRWLSGDENLQVRYIAAKRIQTLRLEEEVLPIADDCKEDKQAIAKARLRIQTRERVIQRLANKVYGSAGTWDELGAKVEVLPPMVHLTDLRSPRDGGGADEDG